MKSFNYVITDDQGTEVTVSVEGDDEETAAAALEKFFQDNL